MPGHALLPALWPLRVTFADGGRMNPVDCVHMLFTMDVEPVKLDVNWTGPDDAPTSERLLRAYRDLVRAHGFPVSLFVHPEAAGLHADLLRDLESSGDCIGLHVHSTKFRHPRYRYEFGYYGAEVQEQILTEAMDEWTSAIGHRPMCFRPGAFSA